jgi:hypothetical protein
MNRRFTVEEAERLLPEIRRLLHEALEQKRALDSASRALQALTQRAAWLGGITIDRAAALEQRIARNAAETGLKAALDAIHSLGVIVKDLDVGLIDFLTSYQGRDVFLCWRLGEPSIQFWHSVDEGFAGRKPIDQNFLKSHRGDPAH